MPIDVTPNYIRIRVENPAQFVRFTIKELGKGIKAVIGFPKEGGSKIQSILFPRSQYTLAQAKAWIKGHGYHVAETQAYNVTDVLFKGDEIYFEETVAEDEELLDVDKLSDDELRWLIS